MPGSYEYFQKYASLLDEGELLDLFDLVKTIAGSLSEAARKCGIERKTIYDMMNKGKQVKQNTKERILTAALTANLEKSIELLLSKAIGDSREILQSYLSLIYQTVMQSGNLDDFKIATSNFESTLDRYAGLIVGNLQEEVDSMMREIIKRGEELGISYRSPRLKVIDTDTLSVMIPGLVRDVITMPWTGPASLAGKWRLDISIVTSASQVVKEYRSRLIPIHPQVATGEEPFEARPILSQPIMPTPQFPSWEEEPKESLFGTSNFGA